MYVNRMKIQDSNKCRYFMLAFLEGNKLIICLPRMKMCGYKCQTALNRIRFHWRINVWPQASDVKNTSTAPLCGYNRSEFEKPEFESTTPESSALPAIIWSVWSIWYSSSVLFLRLKFIFFHSVLCNVRFWASKVEFYRRKWRCCWKL